MRLSKARIDPLRDEDWTQEQRAELADAKARGSLLDVQRTLARDAKAARAFRPWALFIFEQSALSPRHREIAILRIGFLCRSGYEWGQHVVFGKQAGLTDEDLARIKRGPDAPGWTPGEALLVRAADELFADQFVSDRTWTGLRGHFSEQQCMHLVLTVGQYQLVSMMLNTFGVQLDAGMQLDPDLKAY